MRIALIYGGTSAEREVSIKSANAVKKHIDKKKYHLVPIEITKDTRSIENLIKLARKIDVALLVLHGPGGEDGKVQAILDFLGIPYTSSGVLACAIAINKDLTKRLVNNLNVACAKSYLVRKGDKLPKLKGPFVVKPNSIGSSLGTSIVDTTKLNQSLKLAFKYDSEVLIEKYIAGREFTVPVLGDQALSVIEIIPKNSPFFDYKAKYEINGSDEIVPAKLNSLQTKEIQSLARKIHKYLGCKGLTRSDFILSNNKFYFLEINTIPGMTETSLAPKSAMASGISFAQLIDKMIALA